MSFVKTLATLTVGFAAARGVQKYNQMGGMDGVKSALRGAGAPGGMADRMGDYAEKLGVPGGRQAVHDMVARFGTKTADRADAAEAGLGSLFGALSAASKSGASGLGDMLRAATGSQPASDIMEGQARLMIRAMIQAAKADGAVDADERAKIMDHLADASDEELAFVNAELDRPVDPVGLAAEVDDGLREQVYSAALMAITVDSDAERRFLLQFAAALRLPAETVTKIHQEMGKPTA